MKATTNLKQPSALTLNHCSYVTYPIHLDSTYLLTSQVSSYVNISPCHFNGIQTHNHLVRKWTLRHLAKSITIWPVLLNGGVFLYELSGCDFKSHWSQLNLRYCVCFKQGVFGYSGNYRGYIHPKTLMWHDKTIQLPCHPLGKPHHLKWTDNKQFWIGRAQLYEV